MEKILSKKSKQFNTVLQSAKAALDSANIEFHLHYGTSLGAYRERDFIQHDDDIDLAVFYRDVNTKAKFEILKSAMVEHGFTIEATLGKLERGQEINFSKNNVSLDIFFVYEGKYRNKDYYIISSYYGMCDKLKHKTCVWGYKPYKVKNIEFLGAKYKIVPKDMLVEMYGKDWETPKKYNYFDGITQGHYKGFLKDYYSPRPVDKKIAFCFLLYNTVEHKQIWEKFFSGDNYPVPSYNIYSHLKKVDEQTPKWIESGKIRSIKTGWCEESLVNAWINMIKAGLKDKSNRYFAILSGSCIPLLNYEDTYNKIFGSSKSRINVDYTAEAYQQTGLYYADQWVILNRKHAKLLVNLKESKEGKEFKKNMKRDMCVEGNCFCPDELYPVNWFVHKYGTPSSQKFQKEFKTQQSTFTYWDGKKPHPIKFNNEKLKSFKKKICKSGSIFARKFNNKSAKNISMSCKK
jgi:hypothetical protein